jgi:SNF2 family DNA or RNA helicase
MLLTPFPHQLTGAAHLASSPYAGLFDAPRVGKTGAALLAAQKIGAAQILVITTASGRTVWHHSVPQWTSRHQVHVIRSGRDWAKVPKSGHFVVVISWQGVNTGAIFAHAFGRRWDVLILDESHLGKNPAAKRTKAVYGRLLGGGRQLDQSKALVSRAKVVWCLSGSPLAHDSSDIYPMIRALRPDMLGPRNGWPDVLTQEAFESRYTIRKLKPVSNFHSVLVKIGSQNGSELKQRIHGFGLRRTQSDIGIIQPVYDRYWLHVDDLSELAGFDEQEVLAALQSRRYDLDMHLGPLRRITGKLKAGAVVEAACDELDAGLPQLVLAYWHRQVGDILRDGLAAYGVTGIDGSTSMAGRIHALDAFKRGSARVFLAQIEAAGESIDLSTASEMWFVESTFSPRAMEQCSRRVTNINRRGIPLVRVCVLEDSIDELVQETLMRLWAGIREVMKPER